MTSAINPNFITTDPVSKSGMRTQLQTAADEISALQTSLAAKFNSAGGTITGNTTVSASNPTLALRKAASGQSNFLVGYNGSALRWAMNIGDSATESGSNAGSNFNIARHSDAGTFLDIPFTINRSTGIVSFAASPTAPTPSGGDNTTKLATTAFLRSEFTGTNQSLGSNGFQKLPGGLQFKFGTGSTTAGSVVITYPTAFPNATLHVQLTLTAGTTFVGPFDIAVDNPTWTAAGFGVFGNPAQNVGFLWLAIGY